MAQDESKNLIAALFRYLDRYKAPNWLPPRGALRDVLRHNCPKRNSGTIPIKPSDAVMCATAGTEMWLRAVHSFLVSNSLYNQSEIWASVTGYYSSHYVMRAFSHLTGYYLLRGKRAQARTFLDGGKYYCEYTNNKKKNEHAYYWELVKDIPEFRNDDVFSANDEKKGMADSTHRGVANYYDHIDHFPNFRPIKKEDLIRRVERLSELVTDAPTIPDSEKYPDIDSVHIVSYARIVRFRSYLDEVLGTSSRYWLKARNPQWFKEYIDFQEVQTTVADGLAGVV